MDWARLLSNILPYAEHAKDLTLHLLRRPRTAVVEIEYGFVAFEYADAMQKLARLPRQLQPRCMACFACMKQEACAHVYRDLPR